MRVGVSPSVIEVERCWLCFVGIQNSRGFFPQLSLYRWYDRTKITTRALHSTHYMLYITAMMHCRIYFRHHRSSGTCPDNVDMRSLFRGAKQLSFDGHATAVSTVFFLFFFFSFISLIADGPHHYHPACGHKGSSHLSPVHALQFFYRDASSALLQLVNQGLNFTYSRSHAFRYERKNTNPTLVRIELTTSVLADVQVIY